MPPLSASLPIYIQISELLQREIIAGLYAAGDRLPPEVALAKTLNVAVGTLRKALAELALRGLLERRQGSGTYVRRSSSTAPIGKGVYEFFKLELLRGGGLPTAVVIDFQKVSKPEFFAKESYRVRRLRLLGGLPVAIEEIYFNAELYPHVQMSELGEALYLFYQERFGFWIASAEDHIGVGPVPDWSPPLFSLGIGAVCPRIERVSTSNKNTIEEYSVTWFDPERCRYVNRMK